MIPESFYSELNEIFEKRFRDLSLFQDGDTNYLKVFQHALLYSFIKNEGVLLRNNLHLPFFANRIFYSLRSIGQKKPTVPQLRKYVMLDQGRERFDSENIPRSMYFALPSETIGREQISVILTNPKSPIQDYDLLQDDLFAQCNRVPLNSFSVERLKSICRVLRKVRKHKLFSAEEMNFVYSCFHLFFESYRKYSMIFEGQPTTHFLFITHYHREGSLSALKDLGIKTVELQHGLISTNDVYYIYSDYMRSAASSALFADHIVVYGSYWKNMLLRGNEYIEDQITVVGDYTFNTRKYEPEQVVPESKEDLIVVAAQKYMADDYIAYMHQLMPLLKDKHPSWRVILKLHPSFVSSEDYSSLDRYTNLQVVRNEADLFELFTRARIQITIYSTTLYDSLGYSVLNFSLQDFSIYQDYAKEMIREQVAIPLAFDDDPVARWEKLQHEESSILKREEVYGLWEPEKFTALLGS